MVWIDDIVRVNKAHADQRRAKVSPLRGEEPAELPEAIPGLLAWARVICRALPGYICGGAWAGLNLHQRLDFVAICTLHLTYAISVSLSLR